MTPDTPEVIELNLPANYKYLNVLSGCIAELMTHIQGLSDHETAVYNMQLAAHEICANIVGHAYGNQGSGRIRIALSLSDQPHVFTIELEDHGRAFDPNVIPAPTLDKAQIHGYGLFIVENLMDEVKYTPQDNGNHWRLVKRF